MKRLFKPFFLSLLFLLSIPLTGCSEAPQHFYNPSENMHSDPHHIPGDYALTDTNNARAAYQLHKQNILEAELAEEGNLVYSLGMGEISFSSVKNEGTKVFGYFRNYFGFTKLTEAGPAQFSMVIDINSLDTAIPGRNNRILDLFFQSFKPEFGTAKVSFNQFDLNGASWKEISGGGEHTIHAKGILSLNQVKKEIESELVLVRENNLWHVQTKTPIEILISEFNFEGMVYDLMKSCNHQSVSNKVEINADLYFK